MPAPLSPFDAFASALRSVLGWLAMSALAWYVGFFIGESFGAGALPDPATALLAPLWVLITGLFGDPSILITLPLLVLAVFLPLYTDSARLRAAAAAFILLLGILCGLHVVHTHLF